MDHNNILVSVVVPVFNAERFIARTLFSIQQQTFRNLEIITVDDGSTDNSASIIHTIAQADRRIKIIYQPNSGVAAARNTGLRASTGKYVAFIDADDLWHPAKIERQLQKITGTGGLDCVYALYRIIDAEDNVIGNGPYWTIGGSCFSQHIVVHPVGNGSSILVSRSAALAVGGFDPSYAANNAGGAEDLDFELKIAARHKMAAVPEYLVGYRLHEQNMSANRSRMARAMELTLNNGLRRDPHISRNCWKWTTSRLAAYQFFCYANIRNIKMSAWVLWVLMKNDPLFGLQEIPWRLLLRGLRHRNEQAPSPFLGYSSLDIPRRWHRPQIRKRLELLALEDAAKPLAGTTEEAANALGSREELGQNA